MAKAIPIAFGDQSFLGGATMLVSGAVIVGQLMPYVVGDGGRTVFSYALRSGTIAGRWGSADLLSTLATIPDSAHDGGFVCGNDSFTYNVIKTVVCGNADISQSRSNDNSTPQLAPCDAISVGLQFTAVPAQLGQVFGVAPAPAGCGTGDVPLGTSATSAGVGRNTPETVRSSTRSLAFEAFGHDGPLREQACIVQDPGMNQELLGPWIAYASATLF